MATDTQAAVTRLSAESTRALAAGIESRTEARISEIVAEIHECSRRAVDEVIKIGQRLTEAKPLIPHGKFGEWVELNFSFSLRTAENFMNVALRLASKNEIISLLPLSILYSLAAPSTPAKAVDEVLMRVAAGEKLSSAAVEKAIDDHSAIVKRAIKSGTKVAAEIAATKGFVSVDGDSVAIEAAVTEDMLETQHRQTQHIIDQYEQQQGTSADTCYRGSFKVLSVDATSGDLLINAPDLAAALCRGEIVTYIVYQKASKS